MKPHKISKKEVYSSIYNPKKNLIKSTLGAVNVLRKSQNIDNIIFLIKKVYKGASFLGLKIEEGIPVSIFSNDELSSLETIVKYLKENRKLTFAEIASLLNRNSRTIWTTYSKSVKKKKEQFVISESKYYIPIEIFKDRSLGVLENICLYLKDECRLSFHEIAVLLRRNDRTVWTSYSKARGKKKKDKHSKNRILNLFNINKNRQVISSIRFLKKQGYTEEDILKLIKKPEEGIPVSIFANDELSSLESIVKYLKENRNLKFSEIASLLNRNSRTIWTTYSKSVKKKKEQFVISESKYYIPVEIFKDRSLGVLENICLYLKDECRLSFHEIAVLLRRNDRTVWTSYSKARGKKKS